MTHNQPFRGGRGPLILRGRPKLKAIRQQCPTDAVVTCLTEAEGGLEVVEAVREADKEAIWLPFKLSDLAEADLPVLAAGAKEIAALLRSGNTVTIHCSAGLHRTGVVAYASLRRAGYSDSEALATISAARALTAQALSRYLYLASAIADYP